MAVLQYVEFRTRDGRIEYERFPLMCLTEEDRPAKDEMDEVVRESGMKRGTLTIRDGEAVHAW